ncbi:penicillin-insensitive murein endopeptidase [Phaeocystidibacter marisrubri]|uniref:Replication initiation protein n=1 Tax=Phaeocystidibacter marisrubri TaxID=1577780 RepID=A0A6L3ZEJ3_9FLAO|nr:penicillin-insensitive murein endopeptidase [Phaeocystidibacter marisrubri]KAB2816255.1 hypothetical protein F8C82_11245 [Phaeocystidibacter marisrubri]GGH68091.1 hypothetical protein GCM10011318_07770 [Phaeocystidibacter marisrubri]
MRHIFLLLGLVFSITLWAQSPLHEVGSISIEDYYSQNKGNKEESISNGSVGNGSLTNGKLFPFTGANYQYFDTLSYINGRAFLHNRILATVLETYDSLAVRQPDRQFRVMECSNEHGGELYPHRTHQNGLSVDFMMPLIKNGEPYYELDDLGKEHYLLHFNNKGEYAEDTEIAIDFDLVALHLLILDQQAKTHGFRITKVIINTHLKDESFSTPFGQQLQSSNIYVVHRLSHLINALHDDHYHVDFGER